MNEDLLISSRQTAAELLASAVAELFPKVQLVQGCGTSKYFFCDFLYSEPFSKESLSLVEERMRLKTKNALQIRAVEMTPKNAAVRMEHQGQSFVAERLRQTDLGLVQMIEMNGFVDWCEQEFLEKWDSQLAFKLFELLPIQVEGRKGWRLVGLLTTDKGALKQTFKQAPDLAALSHQVLCKRLELAVPALCLGEGLWSWLPAGERILRAWRAWWEKEHLKQNFEFLTTPACLVPVEGGDPGAALTLAHVQCFLQTGKKRLAEVSYVYQGQKTPVDEGLLDVAGGITDRAHLFCSGGELLNECISSLHFIAKIPKILGFEFQIVLYTIKGAKGLRICQQALEAAGYPYTIQTSLHLEEGETRMSVCVSDVLGRWWEGPFLSVCPLPGHPSKGQMLKRSAFGSLERLIALQGEQWASGNAASVDDFLKTMNALNWSKDSESEN